MLGTQLIRIIGILVFKVFYGWNGIIEFHLLIVVLRLLWLRWCGLLLLGDWSLRSLQCLLVDEGLARWNLLLLLRYRSNLRLLVHILSLGSLEVLLLNWSLHSWVLNLWLLSHLRSHLRVLHRLLLLLFLVLCGRSKALPKLHLLLTIRWWHYLLLLNLLLNICWRSDSPSNSHLRPWWLLLLLLSIEINLLLLILLHLLSLLNERILGMHGNLHGLPPH